MSVSPDLIDSIYEAAIIPEFWPKVCESLGKVTGAYGTSVINVSPEGSIKFVTAPYMEEQMNVFSKSNLQNVRPERQLQRMAFSYLRDIDVMTESEIADDPIYNTFLRPLGLGWTMGDVLIEPSGHMIIFDVIGYTDRGPFTTEDCQRMNLLKPDLSRAALMSARLAFEHARSMTQSLSSVGLPSAIMGDNGKVVVANAEFENLAPRLTVGVEDRINLLDAAASTMFFDALERMKAGAKPGVQSIPVAAQENEPALIIHLIPIKKTARDVFSKSSLILLVTPVGAVGPPDVRVLCGLFDLTSSEARVARELTSGVTLEVCATRLGLSLETVRTYLKRIFTKTGTSRQAELVALLAGLGSVNF